MPDADSHAGVGNLDPLSGVGKDFMGDDHPLVSQAVGDQIVIRHLEERADGCRLILLAGGPLRDSSRCGLECGVRLQKKTRPTIGCPLGQSIVSGLNFVRNALDTEDAALLIVLDKPIPKRRAEIEPVVQTAGSHEDIGVQQVGCHNTTPRLRPNWSKVDILRKLRSRSASVKEERPSMVLMTRARAKRLPTRTPSVR